MTSTDAAQTANSASPAIATSAPPTDSHNFASIRTYATAATNNASARAGKGNVDTATTIPQAPQTARSGPPLSQHAKQNSIPPMNGKNAVQAAVPAVSFSAVVNGSGPVNGTVPQSDHSRRPSSVTISALGASYVANGGPVSHGNRPNISFGSMNSAASPAIVNSVPHQSQTASLSASFANPRITSPANSPSPIPQPAASGGKPPIGFQAQRNGLNFGSMGGEGVDMNVGF